MLPSDEETFSSAAVVHDDETFSSAAVVHDDVPVVMGTGQHGDPNDLPKSVLEYYVSIEKVLEREEFDNASERGLLEEKLLEQIQCDGLTRILYHWDCSRVVERLLVNCTTGTLLEMGQLLLPHVLDIACHNFASHVLELFIMKLVKEIRTNETAALLDLAEQVFRKLCIKVTELVSSTHGSYTLRLSLQVLAGVRVEEGKKDRKRWEIGRNSFYQTTETHLTLKRILHKFTKRLVREDIMKMMKSEQGAPLLSVLLMLLDKTHNKSLAQLKTVILTSFDEKVSEYKGVEMFGPLPAVLLDNKGSYVIQALIKVCSKAELVDLYNTHYKAITIPLSLHPVANYTIQSLLEHAPSRDIADKMCGELVPVFEDLLAESITGVVISVIKCCHHHGLTSYNFTKILQDAFHVPDDQSLLFFRCLMSLTTHDILVVKMESYKKPTLSGKPRRDRFEATLAGSLLLQGLFKLGEISKLEEGMCALSEDHLVYLSTDPQSSHAIQAFLTSLTIPHTTKQRFIKTGVFVVDRLVTSPAGSRIVEAMWQAADSEIKTAIAQVLIAKEQVIKDNTYGSIVWRNCNLKSFKMGLKTWEDAERKKKRKIETFEKIINTSENNMDAANVTQNNGDSNTNTEIGTKTKQCEAESPKKKKKKRKSEKVSVENSQNLSDVPKKSKKEKRSSNS